MVKLQAEHHKGSIVRKSIVRTMVANWGVEDL